MKEQWRRSKSMKNYEVSNEGRVRNSKTGRIMKTSINERGYEIVSLQDGGEQYTRLVDRLVAEAFCPDYREGLEVTHRDKNRSKNKAGNLECKTRSEIIQKTYADGRRQTHRMKKIMCVETGKVYDSITECAKDLGMSREVVSKCVNNRFIHNKNGYSFVFVD